MTISAADCPYLAVVSEFAAATAPTPTPSQPASRPGSWRSLVGRNPVASFLVAALPDRSRARR